MANSRILPQSVQIVGEDMPLLRIVQIGGNVIDYELRWHLLPMLARQALAAHSEFCHDIGAKP